MNPYLAYPAFYESFKRYYPNLKVVERLDDIIKADLIIFSGGEDIHPQYYSMSNRNCWGTNIKRDQIEFSIMDVAVNKNKKILGVCRGHQLINVWFRNYLVQDIYLETGEMHESNHKLTYVNNGAIEKFFPNGVNSLHHQGISRNYNLSYRLNVTSYYKDIVESVESQNIIGVQFHPEFMGKESVEFFNYISEWALIKDNTERRTLSSPLKMKRNNILNVDILNVPDIAFDEADVPDAPDNQEDDAQF